MTEEQEAEVKRLAVIAGEKRRIVEALGAINVCGRSEQEYAVIDADYALAQARLMEAETNLRSYMREVTQ